MENKSFSYAYSAKLKAEVEEITKEYMEEETQMDGVAKLRQLDRQAKLPGIILPILCGLGGILIVGFGLSCVLAWKLTLLGTGIGIVGFVFIALAYPLHTYIDRRQKKKFGPRILALGKELLNQ